MFGSQLNPLRQAFLEQFVTDADGLVFRKYQEGAPIRVSEIERDEFISTFDRRVRNAVLALIPSMLGMVAALVWLLPSVYTPSATLTIMAAAVLIIFCFSGYVSWAWSAPARELSNRQPSAPPMTKDEARSAHFSRLSYGQLAVTALFGIGLTWRISLEGAVKPMRTALCWIESTGGVA